MGNELHQYRLSVGNFHVRGYSIILKKYRIFFRLSGINLQKIGCLMIIFLRKLARICHIPFSMNIPFLLILLILLILDNDIHQNPGPNQELSVFHLNARSIRNKLDYLQDIASESSIIYVTESLLDPCILDGDILLEGFSENILRKDRNCYGGGVLVYTSQDICVKRRQDLEFQGGEIIWFETLIPNFKFLICAVYRPLGHVIWENLNIRRRKHLIIREISLSL